MPGRFSTPLSWLRNASTAMLSDCTASRPSTRWCSAAKWDFRSRRRSIVPLSARAMDELVAIAGNASTRTAVTVAMGRPFLKRARRVVVVTVGPQHMPEPGPDGEELARTLERHGMDVSIRTGYGRQKAQGESFLKEAMAAGADLLLKGAYTQSRIRQMIFGGGTRHIIMESQLPVLMAR